MHDQQRPDGTLVEVHDVDTCSGCGQPFERRLYTMSSINCRCAGGNVHRVFICLRDPCRAQTLDPPCIIQTGWRLR